MSFKDLSSKTGTPLKPVPPKTSGSEAEKVERGSTSKAAKEESSE